MPAMRKMVRRMPTIIHTHIEAIMPPIIPCIVPPLASLIMHQSGPAARVPAMTAARGFLTTPLRQVLS